MFKIINYYNFFYKVLGLRIILSVFLFIFIGFIDGFGLSMFLPIFEVFAENDNEVPEKYQFLQNLFNSFGFDFNLLNIIILMFLVFSFKGFVRFLALSYSVNLVQLFAKLIRVKIFKKLNNMVFVKYNEINSGRIQNILTTDVQRIIRSTTVLFKILEHGILFLIYLTLAYLIDSKFAFLLPYLHC